MTLCDSEGQVHDPDIFKSLYLEKSSRLRIGGCQWRICRKSHTASRMVTWQWPI